MDRETQLSRLRGAVSHLERATKCLDEIGETAGHADLMAKTHITSATALLRSAVKIEEKARGASLSDLEAILRRQVPEP